jgi:hypothetical protein
MKSNRIKLLFSAAVAMAMLAMSSGARGIKQGEVVASNKEKFCTDQGGNVTNYQLWNGNAPGNKPVGVPIAGLMKV